MIKHVMRALLFYEAAPFVCPGSAYDRQLGGARQLNRSRADPAARAVNQHDLSRASLCSVKERAISRGVRDVDRRALRVRDVRRKRVNLRLKAKRLLCIRAAKRPAGINPVARRGPLHAFTDGLDCARSVRAWRVRQRRLYGMSALSNVRVDRVDSNGVQPHDNLPGTRCGVWHIFKLE